MRIRSITCAFLVLPCLALADTTRSTYFYEPYPMDPGRSVFQLGLSFTLLPLPLVENEYPTPALDAQFKYGLAEQWSIVGYGSTNVFSTLVHGGPQWNIAIDRFSLGVATHFGGFFGFITTEGQFDHNSAYAVVGIPLLRTGFRFDDFSISTTWAVSYIFVSESTVSGIDAPGPTGTWNDFFCTIAIEQPFLKQTLLSLGVSLSYARTPYQTWLLYNTIDQYLFVPEFFFAVQL